MAKQRRLSLLLGCSAALAASAWLPGAYAQTAEEPSAEDSTGSSDEITITALRRSTTVQDAALSVTAVSGSDMEALGATAIVDVISTVPGLNMTEGNTGQRRLTIRGIQSSGESTVGLYFDEAPVTGPSTATNDPSGNTPDLNMFDIERIEVLRGPQGTLYGSSSMSGTVRIIYQKPKTDDYEGAFDGTISSIEGGGVGYTARVMANAPLVDDLLAARVVLYDEQRAGYVDNVRLGQEDVNESRASGGRFMLGFTPSERLAVIGSLHLQDQKAEDTNGWYPHLGVYNTDNYHKQPYPNHFRLYNLTATYDFDWATLLASASSYDWNGNRAIDGTRGALNVIGPATHCALYFSLPAGTVCTEQQRQAYRDYVTSTIPSSGFQPMEVDASTYEVRLSSAGDGALTWTIGAFFEERSDFATSSTVMANAVTGLPYYPLQYLFARTIGVDTQQTAVFGEATYRPIERLAITFGARRYSYTKDAVAQVLMTSYTNGSRAGPPTFNTSEEDGWVTKTNVSYDVSDDFMIYVQAAQGFRPGGVNNTPNLPPELIAYSSDSLWSYEAGFKSAWFDGRLIANGALYRIDWQDMQITARIPNFSFIGNVGASQIDGLEIELIGRPFEGLDLRAAANLMNAELAEDQVNGIIESTGLAGDRIPNEPEFTLSASVEYTWPVFDGWDAMARLDYSYRGESYSQFRPTSIFYERMGDFSAVNLRTGIESGAWGFFVFMNNVFDEPGSLRVQSDVLSEQLTHSMAPRTIGANVRRSF